MALSQCGRPSFRVLRKATSICSSVSLALLIIVMQVISSGVPVIGWIEIVLPVLTPGANPIPSHECIPPSMPFLFELPTTGAVSFNELCVDESAVYVARLSDATGARANVRDILKETKRAGDERDFLKVVKVSRSPISLN